MKLCEGIHKMAINMRLRWKLMASYLLALFVSMSILLLYAAGTSRDNAYHSADMALTGMVETVSNVFSVKMEQLENMISTCAYREDLQKVYLNQYDSQYDLYLALNNTLYPAYQMVMGYCWNDFSTLVFYSSMGLDANRYYLNSIDGLRAEPWLADAMARDGIVWRVEEGRLTATCRVKAVGGVTQAAVLGLLRAETTEDFIRKIVGINCDAYVLTIRDAQGQELYTLRVGEMPQRRGEVLVQSFEWASEGWTFGYEASLTALTGGTPDFLRVNLLVVMAALALLLVLVFSFTSSMFKRISRLQARVQQVQSGESEPDFHSESRDEIGMLTNAFGEMFARLKEWMEITRAYERNNSRQELRALRAQIDPHFLYNTLSYINWQALRSDNQEIGYAIRQLSTFYRTCLNEGKELISVRQEMENIRAYVSIQRLLHSDGFEVRWQEDPRLQQYQMLSFLLQPLVENAIVHGVDQRVEPGAWIQVETALEGDRMRFVISDNGPGFKLDGENAPVLTATRRHGYGIRNIEQRIQFYYGGKYQLLFENMPEGGSRTTVVLPAICPDAEEKTQ